MRMAVVTHNVVKGDGQGRVNYEIVREALRQGVEVTLVADQVAPALLEAGAQWHPIHPRLAAINLLKVWEFARRADGVLGTLAGRMDMVLANGYVTNRSHQVNAVHFVHQAWRRSPVHTARTQGGPYAWYQWAYSTLNTWWERRAFAQARHLVAVSDRVRSEVEAAQAGEAPITVIPNGVDLDEFKPGTADRQALGLPLDQPLALFVGDLRTARKNLSTVLRAVAQVPAWHLAVVGDVEGSPFPDQARALRIEERVHFLGFRRDVPHLMRAAETLICPSWYEPFGLVVLEALASGLPVITTSTVGAAQLVSPQCGAVLPRPDDVEGLISALQEIVADPVRLQSMRTHARAVAEQHSWAHMARAYLTLFREVVQRGAV